MQICKEIAFTSKTKPYYHKEGGWNILFYIEEQSAEATSNSETEGETIQLSILTQNAGFSYHLYTHMHQIHNPSNISCSPCLICKCTHLEIQGNNLIQWS